MSGPSGILVIGYGNTLRGDDGVGPKVAETVGALRLPGVRTLICQQLSPEHAAPISVADTVIFVDAAVDAPEEVQLRRLTPNDSPQLLAHAADFEGMHLDQRLGRDDAAGGHRLLR